MKSNKQHLVWASGLWLALVSASSLWAADYYWNGANANFTNGADWILNGATANAVPGPSDNANFTNQFGNTVTFTANATNANAMINDFTYQSFTIGSFTYLVTNNFTISPAPAGSPAPGQGAVQILSGTLVVTNSTGTGTFFMSANPGILGMEGGSTLTVDRFIANNSANNQISVNSGTLNIMHGSVVSNFSLFYIGLNAPSTVNYFGGTNITLGSGVVQDGRPGHSATLNVVGPGTVLSNSTFTELYAGSKLVVSNGATYYTGGTAVLADGGTTNASIVVTGPSSAWNLAGAGGFSLNFGQFNALAGGNISNTLTIAKGAQFTSSGAVRLDIADGTAGTNTYNTILVTDPGTVMHVGDRFDISANGSSCFGSGNQLIVSNGATVKIDNTSHALNIGYGVGTPNSANSNNSVTITGPGSIVQVAGYVLPGYTSSSNEWIYINNGGTLEANLIQIQSHSAISNVGGVYQFTMASPTDITILDTSTMTLSNGAISFRGVANADVFSDTSASANLIKRITMTGVNTFELNNSSNRSDVAQSYVFNTGLGATNYASLLLTGAGSRWNSANLTIGSGGSLIVTNTTATVAASVTNQGIIQVAQSHITFSSNLVINGRYVSDPSTNTYQGDVTVGASGTLAGGSGDLFDFKKSFLINNASNPTGAFNLASSTVSFSGGGVHTNAVTGVDLGHNATNGYAFGFTAQNFSYGKLTLGSTSDQLQLTSGDAAASNALYVTTLDLSGLLGSYSSVSQMVSSLLFAPANINIYYLYDGLGDGYLSNQVYRLDSAPGGGLGGLLLPAVPEPSTLMLLGLAALLWRRRQQS